MPPTAPTSLRELKKSQTRQRLAETALRMFAERGYAQTSVEDIAREAQFGVTTFFRHFATKEDVAFYDQGNWMEELPEVLHGQPPEELWIAVRDATLTYIENFQEALGPIRRALWLEEPAVSKRFAEITLQWETVVAQVLADGLGIDVDRDPYPRMAAAVLIGAARAALWHQHRHGGSLVDHARAAIALVEQSLGQPSAR